ncbi:MAG: type I-U CRISPR-associated protein Csb2 [bacterium]|nr:type I-U CRISPR-associated protein Csb2 [bacterium]
MTAIEVNFLTGRYSATSHHDRELSEWPPHGARLFSAMVAAWADGEPPGDAERVALEWLEGLPPPRITAPEAVPRRVVSHFVPVNDANVIAPSTYRRRAASIENLVAQWEDELDASHGEVTKKVQSLQGKIDKQRDVRSLAGDSGKTNVSSALALLPEGRVKKERYFPSVTLVEPQEADSPDPGGSSSRRVPSVVYAWDEEAPPDTAAALDGLLRRVTRLGHSSSLVSCRLRDTPPAPTLIPGEGTEMLRWVRPGQLAALESEHRRHRAVRPRSLPFRGVQYRRNDARGAGSAEQLRPATEGDWIVFELMPSDRRRPMTRAVELARVLREAVLSHVQDPLPEGVSGHLPDGTPTVSPHIGFLALPNVGHEHADGRIMGLAVSLPHALDNLARRATLRGIGKWEREENGVEWPLHLRMGRAGDVRMARTPPPHALVSLRQGVWARPSRWWTSTTPVALPVHPGDLRRGSPTARAKAWDRAAEAVSRSCEHVGLPRPTGVRLSLTANLVGARPARDYPVFRQGRKDSAGVVRQLVHTSIEFAEVVRGPLLLGSGRFLGLGLMRPVAEVALHGATAEGEQADE